MVLEGIKTNSALEFASRRLRDDEGFLLEACKISKNILGFVSKRLRDDKNFTLTAIKNANRLVCASARLRDDKDIVIEAVKNIGWELKYASERLQDDKDVVLVAVKEGGFALKYATDRLQNDKELLDLLEKYDVNKIPHHYLYWYHEKMEVLANIRRQEEKELMENSISSSNKLSKKIKF